MKTKHNRKNCSEDYYILKDSKSFGLLLEVKSYYFGKKETISKIKTHIEYEKRNDLTWKNIEEEKLDVAIVIHVNKKRYNTQDVDNIAKVILDALKNNSSKSYLIKDDSQIIRLLVYKKLRACSENSDTDQVSISIRKHDPKKEMKLIRSFTLINKKEWEKYSNKNDTKN